MKEDLDRLHGKIDKIDDKLDKVGIHLAVYNEQLKIHIKRTELLELDVYPIKNHVAQVSGVLKFLGVISMIVAIAVAIREFS
jgi:hypothetical protein